MVPVPDAPEIVFPANPAVEEDGVVVIQGLGIYDADVSRPGDEDLLFDVWLEAVSGRLSLNESTVRTSPASDECNTTCVVLHTLTGGRRDAPTRRTSRSSRWYIVYLSSLASCWSCLQFPGKGGAVQSNWHKPYLIRTGICFDSIFILRSLPQHNISHLQTKPINGGNTFPKRRCGDSLR